MICASTLRESGAFDVTIEDHNAEREQEDTTTDEKSIEQGVLTTAKVICASTVRESVAVDVTLEDHDVEREQEEAATDEETIQQGTGSPDVVCVTE